MTLEQHIQALLVAKGWTISDGSALAYKDYSTAVGIKRAHAYLANFGPASLNVVLQGDYQSEGRNILESSCQLLPKALENTEHVSQLVDRWTIETDRVVAASYAVRLLRWTA